MEFRRPVFVNLTDTTTYRGLLAYLKKFGKVSNFDDGRMLSTPGCIVFGDVRKIYPPVPLVNGNFNCVFMMKQANHPSASHEEFRILLQLKSPGPLAELDVGSFLGVFNPQPYSVAKMKSFSSGPDGVVVWYSKAPVPVSKAKDVRELLGAPALTSSPKSLGLGSRKKSCIPLHHSQPVATMSSNRSGGSEERVNMPPPSSWIDMKRSHRVHGPPTDDCGLKTSHIASRDGCSFYSSSHLERSHSHHPTCSHHSKCSRLSEQRCLSTRTHHSCCSSLDHQGCCCRVSCQPQAPCCTHREPSNSHGSHHTCGCRFRSGHSSCHQPVGGCSHHHSCSLKTNQCCPLSLCGCNCRKKTDHQCLSKPGENTFSSSSEGSQWFIKTWVDRSRAKIREENLCFPGGNQGIDSQQLTGRATYGGSVFDGAMSDDDNFTSISQILPLANPAQGPVTRRSQQQSRLAPSSSDNDSDSSLSDTSTLFLKGDKFHPSTKPMLAVENALTNTGNPRVTDSSVTSSDMEDSLAEEKGFVADKLPSSGVRKENVTFGLSNQIEIDGSGVLNPDTQLSQESDTQKTCSQTFPSPQIDPSKRPGCRTPSDSEDSPIKTRKKRKLFNPSNSSWIFNSASRDPHVPCSIQGGSSNVDETSDQIDRRSTEVAVVVVGTAKDERNCIVELISQESVGIIPPSDAENERKNNGDEGTNILNANVCSDGSLDKASCQGLSVDSTPNKESCPGLSVDSMPTKMQVEDIIMEWSSDNNSSSSAVPVLKPADGILEVVRDGNHPNIKSNIETNPFIESHPYECPASCSDKAVHLQTSPQLNREHSSNEGVPFTQPVSDEQHQNQSSLHTKASLNKQLGPDDSFYTNETLLDAEMSETLNEPLERTTNVTNTECRLNSNMSLTLIESNQGVNGETHAVGSEQDNLSTLSELGSSSHVDTLNIAGQVSNHGNQISETESSSVVRKQIFIEVPVSVHGVEDSPKIVKEDSKHPSPDSTTDGLSEERRQEEYSRRNSPASTVFYDAESDNPSDDALEGRAENTSDIPKARKEDPKAHNDNPCIKVMCITERGLHEEDIILYTPKNFVIGSTYCCTNAKDGGKPPETLVGADQNIHERVSLPNQIFGIEGVIVDVTPRVNEDTMTTIVKGVCRRGCKSMFDYHLILKFPPILRACTVCASRSHYSCPECHKSGFQKPLCFEFAFELHVLIGEAILRLQVEQQEGVKFLGIRAKEYAKKGTRALEILRQLESLCCADSEEKNLRMTGQVHIKTEQRLEEIVPLLVNTRLKDFRMSRTSL